MNILNSSSLMGEPISDGIQKENRREKMKEAIEIMDRFGREQREQREKEGQFIVNIILIVMTVLGVLGVLGIIHVAKKQNSPSYLVDVDNVISSTDKLNERLKGRMLIMEKGSFSDSASYKEASEIQTELEFVRDKLFGIKIKLKNKSWAN